jgi:hypothetical protein
MWPPALLSIQRKVCCWFLSPLKIHRLGRVWTRQSLGPVTSTLTDQISKYLLLKISWTTDAVVNIVLWKKLCFFGTLKRPALPVIRLPVLRSAQLTSLLDAVWAPGFSLLSYRSGSPSPSLRCRSPTCRMQEHPQEERCTPVRSTQDFQMRSFS